MNTRKCKKIFGLILVITTLIACKTSHITVLNREINSERRWGDTLIQRKEIVKDWLQQRLLTKAFNVQLSPDEFYLLNSKEEQMECNLLPIFCYKIDSNAILEFQKNNSIEIEKIKTLDRENIVYYLEKDHKIYYEIRFQYVNNKWQFRGYGPLDKMLSDSIYNLIFTKKIKLTAVYVMNQSTPSLVFEENSIYKQLHYKGRIIPFKNELLNIVKEL